MKKNYLVFFFLLVSLSIFGQSTWKSTGNHIQTPWAEKVNPQNVRGEYPRPILERSQWMNLNGLWEYAVTEKGCVEPAQFEGNILVPFCIESSLSGVERKISTQQELWYRRQFNIPTNWKGKHILLNFDAVDWQADVYVNDIHIGCHKGGYTGFSFDITPYLNTKGSQKLVVRVWDPSDSSYQACGKQRIKSRTIWYTTVTGIWQTVWLEPVSDAHIAHVNSKADIDHHCLEVDVKSIGNAENCIVNAVLMDGTRKISEARGVATGSLRLSVPNARLWSPEDPFLYTLKLTLMRNGKTIDEVASYAALRKISTVRDPQTGIMRMQLNNKNYFQFGPLDQGWYPDGLYTAATDEALLYDIQITKKLGFNMIRKHVKVEPDRWYYHCDREGLLVWQDMPSGEYYKGGVWDPYTYQGGTDQKRTAESIQNYYQEWKDIIDFCSPHPCVVVWVPFNEDWGQFETEKVAAWTKHYDPSRLVNPASGGNHRPCGDILDIHHYPEPSMPLFDPQRVNVLGEFGGIGLPIAGHLWQEDKFRTYIDCKSKKDVTDLYLNYCEMLKSLVKRGYSAAVYTQTTDVEGEVNGLMTYDRKEIKVEVDRIRQANKEVRSLLDEKKLQRDGKEVAFYTLKNAKGMEAVITNFGGRIVQLMVPDRNGKMQDVVLGFDNIPDYYPENHLSDFGAAIGRYANRINQGRIVIEGDTIQLPKNNGQHCLHGGTSGWQYQVYEVTAQTPNSLTLTRTSPDGDNCFPGKVVASVTYTLSDDNALEIYYQASTNRTTVINMTNHSYFNLNGDGNTNILNHLLTIDADRYTPIDSTFIPIGTLEHVEGTPFDFRKAKTIGYDIQKNCEQLKNGKGYDHNWVLNTKGNANKACARLESPVTGIVMEVYTTEPGLQVYTGNFLDKTVKGKGNIAYPMRSAVCLETQKYPDSPNQQWTESNAYLHPGETYQSFTKFVFSCR